MRVRTKYKFLSVFVYVAMDVVCVLASIMTAVETFYVAKYNREIDSINSAYAVYAKAASLVKDSSDTLSEQARLFCVTGNKIYLVDYYLENSDSGQRKAAMNLLNSIDDDLNAGSYLEEVIKKSSIVSDMEIHAMKLASVATSVDEAFLPADVRDYKLTDVELLYDNDTKTNEAIKLLNGPEYSEARKEIWGSLDNFMDSAVRLTSDKFLEIQKKLDFAMLCQRIALYVFAASGFCLIILLGRANIKRSKQDDQLRKFAEELERKNENLEVITANAKAANKAKSEFLSNMSHDIRTPINGIVGMAEIAKNHSDDPLRVRDCMDRIDVASGHLLAMLNDILEMSRVEQGELEIHRAPINMTAFAESCVSIIYGQAESAGVSFAKEFEVFDHPYVSADEFHLRQAIINILGNAVKFTPQGGTVTFRMRELDFDGYMVTYFIEVEDTGVGMRPEFLKYIWEPFVQERDDARTNYAGTGLGMTITKNYVEKMGGKIEVKSTPDKGSVFTVTIPMPVDIPTVIDEKTMVKSRLNGTRILLVEDNDVNRDVSAELLTDEGAIVSVAEDGKVALSMFTAGEINSYDAILMDVSMPVLDGFKATEAIRALDRPDAKTIPIIALTANAFEKDVRRAREAGMNAHLSKPVDIAKLTQTLLKCMHKQSVNLAVQLEEALNLANTDSLTGVKNKTAYGALSERIDDEIFSGKVPEFSVVVCDINGLKQTNDNRGHEEGDSLIINACKMICDTFKHSPVFRVGGDEFAIILRGEDYDDRDELMQELHRYMDDKASNPENADNSISFASGIADYDPLKDASVAAVFKRADEAMYSNKESIKKLLSAR